MNFMQTPKKIPSMQHSYTFNGAIFHSRSKCVVYFTEEYPSTGYGKWIGLLIRRGKKKRKKGKNIFRNLFMSP